LVKARTTAGGVGASGPCDRRLHSGVPNTNGNNCTNQGQYPDHRRVAHQGDKPDRGGHLSSGEPDTSGDGSREPHNRSGCRNSH